MGCTHRFDSHEDVGSHGTRLCDQLCLEKQVALGEKTLVDEILVQTHSTTLSTHANRVEDLQHLGEKETSRSVMRRRLGSLFRDNLTDDHFIALGQKISPRPRFQF